MPLYDRGCQTCGWTAIDVLEAVYAPAPVCPTCGATTARIWITTSTAVIGDEMDHVQVNGTREPIRFRSKQARKRWLKAQGLNECVRHIDPQEGHSKHTTNWGSVYDPYTAANVKELLERAFHAGPVEPDLPLLPIKTTVRELSRAEAKQYAKRTT